MSLTAIFDFTAGSHRGTCPVAGGGLALADGCDRGEWTSPVYTHGSPFTWAVASWNGAGRRLEVQVRAAMPDGWSPWFSFGPWSLDGERHSIDGQKHPGTARLATDTLLLERPARAWQLRVQLEGASLKRAWLSTALPGQPSPEPAYRAAWGAALAVPLRSQMVYPDGGRTWCSPTSLAMVLDYWGRTESLPDVIVPGVYDSVYEGHGNWPFNTAYAGARGFVAYVDRLPSFAALERWVAAGIPVIASVAYKKEWLPNAPIDQTGGHLLVVCGFTPEGDVIVNEPAAPADDAVRMTYQRDLFRRAWLDRGGVVYLVYPEGHPTP